LPLQMVWAQTHHIATGKSNLCAKVGRIHSPNRHDDGACAF
jgi:hypothetical protein